MGSGPSNPEPRVLQALATAPIAPDDPAFGGAAGRRRGARSGRSSRHQRVHAGGAGRIALGDRSGAGQLDRPGDEVLVGVYGHFGELLCTLATRHGGCVERVEAEWGTAVEPEAIASVRAQAAESRWLSSTPTRRRASCSRSRRSAGRVARSARCSCVDAVLSIGGCEVDVDGWGLDAAVGGLQKCLGGPPGLAPVTYSGSAARPLQRPARAADSAYLARLEAIWVERRGLESAAMSTSMLLAAREALRMVVDEGLSQRWARHAFRRVAALRAGLEAMGLELFGDARTRCR